MTNSRAKGCRGEREWRDVLRAAGYAEARRGQQFRGGADSPDVVGGPEAFHAEVKFHRTLNPFEALDQAATEAAPGKTPYVAWRRNRTPWIVCLRASDFLALARELEAARAAKETA